MLQQILVVGLLILAFPIGYLLAYLTREELVSGRKYFKLLCLISSILAVVFLFYNYIISLSLIFISIVSLISISKSYDKKFVKN